MAELESGFRLGDVVDLVRRQILVIAAAAVVGVILGYVMLASAPTTYSATSRVEVGPDPMDQTANGAPVPPVMETEKQLVKSDSVADQVRVKLKLSGDNRAVRQRIAVVTTDKSTVMDITFTASSSAEAKAGADAVAESYLAARKKTITDARNKQLLVLDSRVRQASADLRDAQAQLDAAKPGTGERAAAQAQVAQANAALTVAQGKRDALAGIDPDTAGSLAQRASTPQSATSKKALAKGVGVFGLCLAAGLAVAWYLDRGTAAGGGRRKVEQLLPDATSRVLPGADGRSASAAEVDTAIDRLAVELVAGASPGRARSVLVIGAGDEPPVSLAEELASSLAFAGIPSLFVLAGSTDRQLRQSQVVGSFADLIQGPSITGPAGLPEEAGRISTSTAATPTVTWLRPRGSAESSGLLRRAVVEAMVTRAARERFEAVVFVAASPTRTAAGSALGQWVDRTALVVDQATRAQAEAAAETLAGAGIAVHEVVWT